MFNSKILKKKHGKEEDMPEEKYETSEKNESYGKPMGIGKGAMNHAMASMAPKGSMKEEKEVIRESEKKIMPQSKIEIELMLNGAKKKKK